MKKIKTFIQENYMFILFCLVLYVTLTFPLPYYIYTSGGVLSVEDKIDFTGKTESKGSYNLCYVKELQATIPTYLLSYVMPKWDMVKKEEVTIDPNESSEDMALRDKLYLNQANNNAIIVAFNKAGKDVEILDRRLMVLYKDENVNTDIHIGDEIIEVDGIKIEKFADIAPILNKKNIGDKVSIKVIYKEKEYDRYAYIIDINGEKKVGLVLENMIYYKSNPELKLKFKNSEGGPSGGFMMSLAIYDYLIDKDLTKGLIISGTGTIDEEGNVGTIDGVKYKLEGAVREKSDIFFVPTGENYKEAKKIKEKYNYKIDVVEVKTIDDAIKYLESR